MNRWKRSLRPARMPSGMPIASDRATAFAISTSVWIVSVHRPSSAIAIRLPSTRTAVRHETRTSAIDPAMAIRPTQLNWARTNETTSSRMSIPARIGPRT